MHWRSLILKEKKNGVLTKEQQIYENAKLCYICNEKLENKYVKDKKYCRVRHHCYYTGNIEVLFRAYVI